MATRDDAEIAIAVENADMPENDMPVEQPLPRFVTLFAPWRWFRQIRPWKRGALLMGMGIVGYIESPLVIIPILNLVNIPAPTADILQSICEVVWYPLGRACETFPAIRVFYDVQSDVIEGVYERLEAD